LGKLNGDNNLDIVTANSTITPSPSRAGMAGCVPAASMSLLETREVGGSGGYR
jgi:hypothetical protein